MVRRFRKLLPVAWLMALLLLPVVAYVAGVRQPLLENRGKTAFPHIDRTTIRKGETFRQMDAAIRERLPLRGQAIDIRGKAAMKLFGESTNADVILGKDGWLYYRPELRICEPNGRPAVKPEDAVEVLARTIAASGRRPVIIIAGSKIATHRAHLNGVSEAELACLRQAESQVQSRLEEVPGGSSIQAQLDAFEAANRPTFLRSDTHWNALGRQVFLRALLDGVRPGLASEVRLRPKGQIDRSGDLGPFLGQHRIDKDRLVTVTGQVRTRFAPGEVLIVGDSQMWNSVKTPGADGKNLLEHVFPGQRICDQYEMQEHGCADPMLDSETVVIESVARNYELLTTTCWRPVATLAKTMEGRRARWADGDPARRPVAGAESARVELAADRTDALRLLRIPVLNRSSEDIPVRVVPKGRERPCALTEAADEFDEIVIPVEAGEQMIDVELQVSGPEDAQLGRPEVVLLDKRAKPVAGK